MPQTDNAGAAPALATQLIEQSVERARRLLRHYLKLATQDSIVWEADHDAEVNDIVDCLLDAMAVMVREAVGEHNSTGHTPDAAQVLTEYLASQGIAHSTKPDHE